MGGGGPGQLGKGVLLCRGYSRDLTGDRMLRHCGNGRPLLAFHSNGATEREQMLLFHPLFSPSGNGQQGQRKKFRLERKR